MITAFGEIGNAVDAIRKGAYDYLVKGEIKSEELIVRIERALENQELRRKNTKLKTELKRFSFGNMVGKLRSWKSCSKWSSPSPRTGRRY